MANSTNVRCIQSVMPFQIRVSRVTATWQNGTFNEVEKYISITFRAAQTLLGIHSVFFDYCFL